MTIRTMMNPDSIGVCAWSIDRQDVLRAVTVAAEELHVRHVQLGFFDPEALQRITPADVAAVCERTGVKPTGVFIGFPGEDYASIAAIDATGGFLPDDAWPQRRDMMHTGFDWAGALHAGFVACHMGTVPAAPGERYDTLLARTAELAAAAEARGLKLLIETGREPVERLLGLISDLRSNGVAVSFDPANLVIYATDDPVRSVSALRDRIACVHVKDARPPARPRVDLGSPAPLGQGEVHVARVISKLRAAGYAGPLLIETGGGLTGLEAVRPAVDYLRSMLV